MLNDLNHVLLSERADAHVGLKSELLVQPVTSDIAKVIPLVGEEELVDSVSRGRLIGRLGVTELPVYVDYSLLFGVAGVFLKSVVNNGVIGEAISLAMEEDGLDLRLEDSLYLLLVKDGLTINDDLVALDGDDLV